MIEKFNTIKKKYKDEKKYLEILFSFSFFYKLNFEKFYFDHDRKKYEKKSFTNYLKTRKMASVEYIKLIEPHSSPKTISLRPTLYFIIYSLLF